MHYVNKTVGICTNQKLGFTDRYKDGLRYIARRNEDTMKEFGVKEIPNLPTPEYNTTLAMNCRSNDTFEVQCGDSGLWWEKREDALVVEMPEQQDANEVYKRFVEEKTYGYD